MLIEQHADQQREGIDSNSASAVSGAKTAMLPNADFAWFPLANPGIVSIPLAFILGIVGTMTSPVPGDLALDAEMEVRSLTGVGAEKAVAH